MVLCAPVAGLHDTGSEQRQWISHGNWVTHLCYAAPTEFSGSVFNYITVNSIVPVCVGIKMRGKEEKICINHRQISFSVFDFNKRLLEKGKKGKTRNVI